MGLRTKILIVDDEDMIREILVEEFSEISDEVLQAPNGRKALDIIRDNPDIDAVFSDVSMPEMTGLDLLEYIIQDFPLISTVMLSAYSDKKNTEKALLMGAMDFITKPFQVTELEKVARKAIELGQLNKKIAREVDQLVANTELSETELIQFKKSKHQTLLELYQKEQT